MAFGSLGNDLKLVPFLPPQTQNSLVQYYLTYLSEWSGSQKVEAGLQGPNIVLQDKGSVLPSGKNWTVPL